MQSQTSHSDLYWSLAGFSRPNVAVEFFNRFNRALAVYSGSVEKIYTDYSSELVDNGKAALVIQPDFYKFSSMFHHVTRNAIRRTSVLLFENGNKLKLSGVLSEVDTRRSFDLKEGLFRLFDGQFDDGPFIPVLTYGDLRTLPGQGMPMLQVHQLRPEALGSYSSFQRNDLIAALQQNLMDRLADI